MEECKVIVFREDDKNPGMERVVEEEVRKWYDINKDNISNIHSIFGIELDDDSPSKSRKILTVHYNGEAGNNPTNCKHENYFDKIIVPGSCDHYNIHGRFCSNCNILLSTYTTNPGIKHKGNFISNNDATCLEDGTHSGTCDVCGEWVTDTDIGSALGHDYVWSTHEEATCFSNRVEIGICSRCNDTIYRIVENSMINHNYIWSTEIPETCENDRVEIGVCSVCGDIVRKTIINTKLEHDYVYTSNGDATCLQDGTKTGICSKCGKVITKSDPGSKLGHTYQDNWEIRKNADCLSDGLRYKKCIRCDNEITEVITKLGHTYPTEWSIRKKATCVSSGLRYKKCIRCDNEITEFIAITGHNWISNNNGTHRCTVADGCNAVETCSPNYYGDTCSKCGYKTPNLVLKILTEYINGMVINTSFNQKIECNAPNSYYWYISSGSLPPGITFSNDGVLNGKPTSSGVYTFTIKCDWNSQTVSKQYSVNIAAELITITFNPTGGITSESSRKIAKGSLIGKLPDATRDGYEFGGWFTAETGGLKVDENYSVASTTTLYARWGQGSDLNFGDATSTFNIQYNGDRTNYNNDPYTFYSRYSNGKTSNLVIQTAISSIGNSNNMTDQNDIVKLYMKVTNNGDAGVFDIGFDCDSYVEGDDCLYITRIENGVNLNDFFEVTVPYETSIWAGKYNGRVSNRYTNVSVGTRVGKPGDRAGGSNDTGYAFTMNNIFINSSSYTILEVTFRNIH